MAARPKVHAIFANYCTGFWVSYTLLSLLEGMQGDRVDTHAYVLGRSRDTDPARVTALLSNRLFRWRVKLLKDPTSSLVRRFSKRFRLNDIVYFWLDSPLPRIKELKNRGLFVVREMINCTQLRRQRELRAAYSALGLSDASGVSTEAIEREREQLLAMDAVFCPSDAVYESVIEYGVPPSRCIRTSYGWGEDRITCSNVARSEVRNDGLVVLFVGTGDVRKGLPWLLQAWAKANVRGELRLAGVLDSDLKLRYRSLLDRKDVRELGFVHDVEGAYSSADVFCFPSWEEGCPLVTIEAMACGLPCVVTPMGGGSIVRDGQEGIVVQPGDIDGMADALTRLAVNVAERRRFGEQARISASNYTWRAVSQRRVDALLEIVKQRV